ncbi:hypothetical protein GCM10011613_31770 [Cellvibrio zantedeschiae]|uniref:PD-(D/E)XK motif protein n=1 Tax=Cellvibrio zantedeschiae TaxID=1237077 RepID=A0ABQ3BBF4_9GAMM|nr:PD-(D/E)XK motif protein [Cellvibrio zantedeschiae]GGY84480.1 hypothetical protein GCM10011613_31770 [Cellvibrio zantedeschiae]
MMINISPWDEINIPEKDFNVRQISERTVAPCYWARDPRGNCLFIIELEGDHTLQFRKDFITVNGINIDLRSGGHEQQRIILSLEKQVDRDIFEALCKALIVSLRNATDSASSLAISLSHLRRWKAFLAGHSQQLSVEEVRGLFAEITFLSELLDQDIASNDAVASWLGAERSHHDFIFGNTSIEVKSISGIERGVVCISSEDQLESVNDFLFLRIYRLSAQTKSPAAKSLNEAINITYIKLKDAEAIDAFDKKLAAYGYVPIPQYDLPRFVISEVNTYKIDNDFPRLIRSQLPAGVTNVSYYLKLENIASHKCDERLIFKGI